MVRIFARQADPSHPLEPHLALMEATQASQEDQAMAWNLRNDWRVSPAREESFLKTRPAPSEVSDHYARDWVRVYFKNKVRHVPFVPNQSPDFASVLLNSRNRANHISADWPLVTIIDVGRLFTVVNLSLGRIRERLVGSELARELTGVFREQTEWVEFLDQQLEPANPSTTEFWMETILSVIAGAWRTPFNPVWVMPLPEFAESIGHDGVPGVQAMKNSVARVQPARWLEVAGIPAPEIKTWLLVLCYPAAVALELYRPTQLDAGWFPQHYPSPRSAGGVDVAGGRTLDLGVTGPGSGLISEFIHPQVIDSVFAANWREYCLVLSSHPGSRRRAAVNLSTSRANHRQKLENKLPSPLLWE